MNKKLLGDNIGENLYDLKLGKEFLNTNQKTLTHKTLTIKIL